LVTRANDLTEVGQVSPSDTTHQILVNNKVVGYFFVDPNELPDYRSPNLPASLQNITYFVKAQYVDDDNNPQTALPLSGPSNFASVQAVNVAPVANPPPNADSYSIKKTLTLNIAAPGVLSNDTDVDSPAPPTTPYSLRAVLVTGPSTGTLTLNANGLGGFTYQPASGSGATGTFTFTYKVYNTCSLAVQCSPFSNVATVTITVTN
jgi:hypothetical protein